MRNSNPSGPYHQYNVTENSNGTPSQSLQQQQLSSIHIEYCVHNDNNDAPSNNTATNHGPNSSTPQQHGMRNKRTWNQSKNTKNGGCKDIGWAVLFYVHLLVIGLVTILYAPKMATDIASEYAGGGANRRRYLENNQNQNTNKDTTINSDEDALDNWNMGTIYTILVVSGVSGFAMATLAMGSMILIPTTMIKIALLFTTVVAVAMTIVCIVIQAWPVAVMACIGVLFTMYYTYIVWKRIPFAASTLITAISAINAQKMGLFYIAFHNLLVTFVWSLWWSLAFVATSYVLGDCNVAEMYCNDSSQSSWKYGCLLCLFLVSYFWVCQVIKNVVHCTVAGTVGTWWFVPDEATSSCSSAVRDSYCRSITTSFGPICFGSLVVATIQATCEIINSIRREDNNGGLLFCLIGCLLQLLESLAEMFNKWAYIYVGIYGYGFIEASKSVIQLFQARGWTSIIADLLIDTVLLMVSICVGVITGIIGAIVGSVMHQNGTIIGGAFIIGMIIGFVLCSTLFGLISSAVNTVIVCFAEAPADFQHNHPVLSSQMIVTWRDAYPNEFRY